MAALPMIRKSAEELEQIRDVDWARLAAFIDGEGCIRIRRQKRHTADGEFSYDLELTVANTSMRLLHWLRNIFGGTVFQVTEEGYQARRHACFYWRCRSSVAGYILERCLPFFVIKGDQAETALGFQLTKRHWREHLRFASVEGVPKKRMANHYIQGILHRMITRQKDCSINSVQ